MATKNVLLIVTIVIAAILLAFNAQEADAVLRGPYVLSYGGHYGGVSFVWRMDPRTGRLSVCVATPTKLMVGGGANIICSRWQPRIERFR